MYNYYNKRQHDLKFNPSNYEGAKETGDDILNATMRNPDYLILRKRKNFFIDNMLNFPVKLYDILDIGGRIQPYRPIFEGRINKYVAVDPICEGLVDIIAVGEHLPFRDCTFDLVICTQVLGYANNPIKFVSEIHRVMKIGGNLLFSVPSLALCHHDERWRFLPDGLRLLFSDFHTVEISPEGTSAVGIFRTINNCIYFFVDSENIRSILSKTIIPLVNMFGCIADRIPGNSERFVVNICVHAIK